MTTIQTVKGSISSDELGLTLMHEHIINDAGKIWEEPLEASRRFLAEKPVSADILFELKYDPYVNKDNLRLNNLEDAVDEVGMFRDLGGVSIVDAGNRFMGRDPLALLSVSNRTGLNIIMGTGYHLEGSLPSHFDAKSIDSIADEIIREMEHGVDDTGIKPGIIGEIGVGLEMTTNELKSLRASCKAQIVTHRPLTIHTHGWGRDHHQILDIVEEQGVKLENVILEHMNPCWGDPDYLISLAGRGAYIEFDMIGMDMFYPSIQGQSPSDEQVAACLFTIIQNGFTDRILLSQDVFLKMMLTKYGGLGYGHILRAFVPRLRRMKIAEESINEILIGNPKQIFESSAM